MNQSNLITEKQDLLITPHLVEGQLPTLLEEAVSVAPVGETRDMLLIGHKLLMHAAMVFQMMPELKATPVGEIWGNMLQKQFFQMLPTDFTKQEAVKQAEVLGVALSTMERWITKSVQTAHKERLATGLYRKKPSCIA